MDIQSLHHISLTVTDLSRSRRFYQDVLELEEIDRPDFSFPGAWFQIGEGQSIHLIVHTDPTMRGAKGVDTRDNHFAVRVPSYRRALEFLRAKGYHEDAGELDLKKMRVNAQSEAGVPQIFILDPDRHVIEINAERLD
jgi:glyoxylase I family protein